MAVRKYGDMLFRICFMMLGNQSDAEEAAQEGFISFLLKAPGFETPEHEKARLITVAGNKCRDMLRFRLRHPQTEILEYKNLTDDENFISNASNSVLSGSGGTETYVFNRIVDTARLTSVIIDGAAYS